MAEQAHFAKYKISLKNNNKESQQVNRSTGQRANERLSQRADESTSQRADESTGQRGHEGRAIRKFENSRIQEFVEVDRQKRRRNLKNFSSLQLFNHFFSILLSVFEHRQPKDWSCCPFSGSKVNCHLRYRDQIRFQHTF